MIDGETLRRELVEWMLKNKRIYSCIERSAAEDLRESFKVPETEFIMTELFPSDETHVTAVFKTEIRLPDWQTKSGKEAVFEYYKIDSAALLDGGEVPAYLKTVGYIITTA